MVLEHPIRRYGGHDMLNAEKITGISATPTWESGFLFFRMGGTVWNQRRLSPCASRGALLSGVLVVSIRRGSRWAHAGPNPSKSHAGGIRRGSRWAQAGRPYVDAVRRGSRRAHTSSGRGEARVS